MSDTSQPQYIDLTPTWSAIVPLIAAGLQQHRASYDAMLTELYRMAALADAANEWLPRLVAHGDVLAASAKVKEHRHWVAVRSEYEDYRRAMAKRVNRNEPEVAK